MVETYIPSKGDIVWLDFDPQFGNEIKKRRPALVLSSRKYNHKSRFALFIPATTTIKNLPFEVKCTIDLKESVFLADQIHSFDWRKRNACFIECALLNVLEESLDKILTILEDPIRV